MIDLGNTRLKDKYIYSGYLSKTQSFDATGTYQGDSNNIEIFIGDGIKSRMNVTGDVAFNDTTKLVTGNLPATMSGNIRITSGAGTPYYLEAGDVFANATPEAIRDTINAPMSGTYDSTVPDVVGTGTLTLKAGSGSPVTLTIDSTNDEPSEIRDAINTLNMGITAGIFQDAAGNERLFFRATTAGESFSIEVSDDDGNDTNTSGLSALHHTDLKSNLTSNALGVEALILDDGTNKRMVLEPMPANTTFTIDVDEAGDGWNGAADIDTTGLSNLYHQSSAVSNIAGNSISFFSILNHFDNALSTNNREGIESSILFVDGALDSVMNTIADVGSRLKYFEDQQGRLEDSGISFKKSLSVLEDADIAAAAMELTKIQTTLEAMRISSVKNLTQSLFDFMG
jgi:flagellin-like hook-associated protein FlgL